MFTPNETLQLVREGINHAMAQLLSNPAKMADPLLRFALMVMSTKLQERYDLELLSIVFREWTGARRFRNAGEIDFVIKNKAFEASIACDRDVAEDSDFAAKLQRLISVFMEAFESKKADLVAYLLLNGASLKCYDGQNMFDTDHPIDDPTASGSLQNYWSSGMALTRANIITVETAMTTRPRAGDSTDIRMVNPRVLLVPPALRDTADQIVNTTEIVDGSGNRMRNTMYQRFEVVVSGRLQSQPTAWYLIDPDYKFVIVQVRKGCDIVVRNDPRQDNMFHHRQIEVGADGRMGAGYGPWQGIAKALA